MPRRRIHPGPIPDFAKLYETAQTQAGYFTTIQAGACGYSRPLLHHHVQANRFERAAHGIYRLVQFPTSDHEDLVVTWLWSVRAGTFSHETALVLHQLSDALPSVKHLTLPASWKRRRLHVPPGTFLHFSDLPPAARGWRGPIPVTTPLRTVTDLVQDHADVDLVRQAIEQGLERGMFDKEAVSSSLAAIDQDPRPLLRSHRRRRVVRR
jgi:predicted transcriptional regulator of viral defense system